MLIERDEYTHQSSIPLNKTGSSDLIHTQFGEHHQAWVPHHDIQWRSAHFVSHDHQPPFLLLEIPIEQFQLSGRGDHS
jgi:hypothetical protein